MKTSDLDFDLPRELIAQLPPPQRAASRLLHYRRSDQSIAHRVFADLPSLLRRGDLLVFNNARVVPARFEMIKPTGGRVEGLFLSEESAGRWRVLLKNVGPWTTETIYTLDDPAALPPQRGRMKVGAGETPESTEAIASDTTAPSLPSPEGGGETRAVGAGSAAATARIVAHETEGQFLLEVRSRAASPSVTAAPESAYDLLARIGRMPLPPYIRRDKHHDDRDALDRDRYQTVYAAAPGSVAAPTAGLHFDDSLLQQLQDKGVKRAQLTLNVGLGTFKPVTAETLEDHAMHVESYAIDDAAADAINRAKREGRRVVAVGTTAARVLESQPPGELRATAGETGIFIYPPYTWKHVDALITNFHLPRSTLIALVAAFVGLDAQRRIYAEAIANRYRFFSYGDASFLE
jgi:S-adenosylmethionine:tRNA ribosyltransferase-isomerase